MMHAGDNNSYDENGKYHEERIMVPSGINILSEYIPSGKPLKNYITSPINQQPANKGQNTISIKQMYIHRFGNNTPKATLTVDE